MFYHKDVITLLKQAPIYQLLYHGDVNIIDRLATDIAKNNVTFLGLDFLKNYFDTIPISVKAPILDCFEPFQTITDFLARVLALLLLLKETANEMEKEYLFRFYTVFVQLQNLHATYGYIKDIKTLHQLFKQLMQSESISFQGEPLQGLQLMGVLETRVLDFDTVIITSVNEGVLPKSHQQNSFVPLDVKIEFGLPTYREKDALFSYHFFRLLQRASNIFILYNTEHDSYGSGEKSRFLTQLELLRKDIKQEIVIPNISTTKTIPKEILKNESVFIRLKELATKGISPSALTNYLYNPMAFYKQKVLRIKELEDVEETIAVNTMGTVVHDTLEHLYEPYIGKYVTAEVITTMETMVEDVVVHYFKKHFKNGNIIVGKNRLIFEVAKRFVSNFLQQEKRQLQDPKNKLKIIATEQTLSTEIRVEGFDFPIKIHGQVDRIDQWNGVVRIIDYKTGRVDDTNLKISDFTKIEELKYHKAIQVMLYAFLYTKHSNFSFNQPLEAGIYSFKNLGKGFLKMNFSSGRKSPDTLITPERLEAFMEEIKEVLKEIYDPSVSFTEPLDLKY
ncbi:PD-(D/E)XK nuclease family protein [Tenacibaculum sp. SG-28]|uniref:PD-(D/E)XK nuclease family protein n=1 Tax=Tenacibaculum sp. SG-28 TaxID=754426 RepID=UPI001E334A0A|nr:PD-(D/E)XK nuclease family protein [Tenacibaculum sp. SG-28]